jgi:3-keto-disaccharide hydrolase
MLTPAFSQRYKPLFNGKDLSGWYLYLQSGVGSQNKDSAFIVQDSILYVTGKSVGYISTEKEYKNFHLVLDFKWGETKYPPRLKEKRDSGILYYFAKGNPDKIWPRAYECQIQEGDCGDFWLSDSTGIDVKGKRYKRERVIKFADAERPNGEWNRLEVVAVDGKCTHIMNGVVVNEGTGANIRQGKIAIQTEAAEMYFKNIRLAELK